MNKRLRQLKTRWGPDSRFEVSPTPAAPFRGALETELDYLKDRLLRRLLDEAVDPDLYAPLRRAANEAASLAWITPYPLLVFPALLEEKAGTAQAQYARQRSVRRRSEGLLEAAVA